MASVADHFKAAVLLLFIQCLLLLPLFVGILCKVIVVTSTRSCPFLGGDSAVVYSLFIIASIVCVVFFH